MSPAVNEGVPMTPIPENELTPIPLAEIEAVVFNTTVDPPNIVYWLSGGETYVNATTGLSEFTEFSEAIQEALSEQIFVRYLNMFFRADRLQTFERCFSQELGDYLSFVFLGGHEYREQYVDMATLDDDMRKVTEILSTLQDIRASKHASSVKH